MIDLKIEYATMLIAYGFLLTMSLLIVSAKRRLLLKYITASWTLAIMVSMVISLIPAVTNAYIYENEDDKLLLHLDKKGVSQTHVLRSNGEESCAYMLDKQLISVLDDHEVACRAETNIIIIACKKLNLNQLECLPALSDVIVAKNCSWRTSKEIEQFCADKNINFHQTRSGLKKLNL